MKGRVKSSGSSKSGGFGNDRGNNRSGGSSRTIGRASSQGRGRETTGGAAKSFKGGERFSSKPVAPRRTESDDERLWKEWGLGNDGAQSPRPYRSETRESGSEKDSRIGGFKLVKKKNIQTGSDSSWEKPERSEGPKRLTTKSGDRRPAFGGEHAGRGDEGRPSYGGDRKPSFDRDRKSGSWSDKPRKVFNLSDDRNVKEKQEKAKNDDGKIRLNRYIANSGICSRREADTYIQTGLVQVNGVVVTEMGVKVSRFDEVKFDGQMIKPEKKVYILLNKPKGYVTTTDDPEERKTVMDLIGSEVSQRVYPVGRLDRNTTGVILLTNDGELTKSLTHPKYNRKKIYHVSLDKNVTKADMEKLVSGIELEDGLASADVVDYPTPDIKSEIGIEIHSGKNRIVRRMMEALGYDVVKLDRVFFCGMTKKGVARGKWRFLSDVEVNMLRMGAYE